MDCIGDKLVKMYHKIKNDKFKNEKVPIVLKYFVNFIN